MFQLSLNVKICRQIIEIYFVKHGSLFQRWFFNNTLYITQSMQISQCKIRNINFKLLLNCQ